MPWELGLGLSLPALLTARTLTSEVLPAHRAQLTPAPLAQALSLL